MSTLFPECRGELFLCLSMLSSKANQLYWDPFSFGADSHGVTPNCSLNDPKSALLKPRICDLLLAFLPRPPQELDSIISWSLQHYSLSISPAWTFQCLCNKKLFFTPSSHVLDGWRPDALNFPMRVGVCDIEPSSGCSEKASSASLPRSEGCNTSHQSVMLSNVSSNPDPQALTQT